jgi:hypothetical protein
MTPDPRRGARLDDGAASPSLRLAPLLRRCAEHGGRWIRSTPSGATTIVDLDALLGRAEGGVVPVWEGRHDAVVLGGSVPEEDQAETADLVVRLRTAIARQLDAAPQAVPATPEAAGARATSPFHLRLRQARLDAYQRRREHNALIVLSTEEQFPDRGALCSALERGLYEHLTPEAARRFIEHLPWESDRERDARSAVRRSLEEFICFLQEYGMARLRLRVAFGWLDAMCTAIAGPGEQRVARRYARALREIVLAAEGGATFADSVVPPLGLIRPTGWSGAAFVQSLPLVPRADCELAAQADDEAGRRGHERTERGADARGRPEQRAIRHVTYLPRFNATGRRPALGQSARYETTLQSRWGLLSRALRDGTLTGNRPLDPERLPRVQRALEQHVVVRAAVLAAFGEVADAVGEARRLLEGLSSAAPADHARTLEQIVSGYAPDTPDGIHARLEGICDHLAEFAGKLEPLHHASTWTVLVDGSIFDPSERSPFVRPRGEDEPRASAPWNWIRRLHVVDGATSRPGALGLAARITLEPLALTWPRGRAVQEIERSVESPLRVVLLHSHPDMATKRRIDELVRRLLGGRPELVLLLPACAEAGARFEATVPQRRRADLAQAGGAAAVGALALGVWLERVDPEQRRGVLLLTLFDASLAQDLASDAALRAVSRALDGACGQRPVVSQGLSIDTGEPAAVGAVAAAKEDFRDRGIRAALQSLGEVTMGRLFPRQASDDALGILVLGGRPVDCVLSSGGRPKEALSGRDLLWGSAYLARAEGASSRLRRLSNVADVLSLGDPWPSGVTSLLDRFQREGCSRVVLVTHRAFERRTFRTEARNRFYDGELPLQLLAALPHTGQMRLFSVLCDQITAIAAEPTEGTVPSQALFLVGDPEALGATRSYAGLQPLVAVATNRAVRCFQKVPVAGAPRRVGLRRSIFVYLERGSGASDQPRLGEGERALVADALVGLHLLEAERVAGSDDSPWIVPVLSPHRVFDIVRSIDASELTWRLDHLTLRVNLAAVASVARSFARPDPRARRRA